MRSALWLVWRGDGLSLGDPSNRGGSASIGCHLPGSVSLLVKGSGAFWGELGDAGRVC